MNFRLMVARRVRKEESGHPLTLNWIVSFENPSGVHISLVFPLV